MPRKADSPVSRHKHKSALSTNGNIGFPRTQNASEYNTRVGGSGGGGIYSSEKSRVNAFNSEDDLDSGSSCDSCSELTHQYNKRKSPTHQTCQVKTYRPVVRFKCQPPDMDEVNDENVNSRNEIDQDLRKLSRKGPGSLRYTQPRLSLLGKPISYKMHRRDVRYRRLQAKIYNFLERPKVWYAFMYHIGICVICVGALVLSTLCTIDDFEVVMTQALLYIEPTLLVWLVTEYIVRIWASGCRSRYQGCQGRMRFAQRPLCIIDAVIILSTLIVILVGSASDRFAASTLRGLRFFQILRMVRMDRRAATWKLLASVIWAHRRELLTTVYIGILGLLFSSYLVYLAEKDYHKTKFATFADALWWGVVTLCTVGYGDVVPDTWAGKLIASFSATLGIAFFALPAGILGSGFALKVQQQQRQKHLIRRRVPAALLIQSLWRCYAADEHSISIATWKPHMIPCPSPTTERPFKNNASFVSRFSTRRKDRGGNSNNNSGNVSPHSPMVPRRDRNKQGSYSEDEVPDTLQSFVNRTWSHLSLATGLVDQRVDRIGIFKDTNSTTPFGTKQDNQDNEESDHQPSKFCLKPIQSEEEQPDLSPKIRDLTSTEKKAIRALRKIKYFVARKKFREALRPYDVKDVIEQYSAGHVDMLSRVKCLQFRLDQILGKSGSKNKDVYESKVSLSSRIVKVERQVEDIDSKLDLLIDLYKDDRRILLQQQQQQNKQETSPPSHEATQNTKPRSILIDKQYVSEPSTPILEKHPSKVMLRNHSDLSSRIRKRVTYRLQTPCKVSVPPDAHDVDSLCNRKSESDGRYLESIKSCSIENDAIDSEIGDVFRSDTNESETICTKDGLGEKSGPPAPGTKTMPNETSLSTNDCHMPPRNIVKLSETRQRHCGESDQSGSSCENNVSDTKIPVAMDKIVDKVSDECLVNVGNGITTQDADSMNEKHSPSDHVILMPIGTMQALAADSSDV